VHTFSDLSYNDLYNAYAGVLAEVLAKFKAPEGVSEKDLLTKEFESHVFGACGCHALLPDLRMELSDQ